MAKEKKKLVRAKFNQECLDRDDYTCRLCTNGPNNLDVHHITDRNELPNGGYVKENGITLCKPHHFLAETGRYTAEELYELIGSSYEIALDASTRLC